MRVEGNEVTETIIKFHKKGVLSSEAAGGRQTYRDQLMSRLMR